MAVVLGANQYGKAENRVVRIYRDTARHEIRDLNVSTSLRGDFAAAHTDGDQADVLPTDTQKNTAFAYAKEHGVTSPEDYAIALGRHFLDATPAATAAQIGVEQYAWDRIAVGGTATTTPSSAAAARCAPRVVTVDGRGATAGVGRFRRPGPRGAEVDRLGVQGLPDRRVHDPGRDRRPDPGHLAGRALALRTARTSTGTRRYDAVQAAACSRPSRRRTAGRCRRPCTRWARACSPPPGDRRDPVLGAQQAPLPRRPRAVRAEERQRGLHRGRPPVRADRGDGGAYDAPEAGNAWLAVPAFL